MMATLHILSNPYGITDIRYRNDAFAVAIIKMIMNLRNKYKIIHYGHELSVVPCEHVSVSFSDVVPKIDFSELFQLRGEYWEHTHANLKRELLARVQPGDIVLCFWAQGTVMEYLPDYVRVIEPSIGYDPIAAFARYKVFVSYASMHYYYGIHRKMNSPEWFDAVIPNAFSSFEFDFNTDKDDYMLFLGRVTHDKGVSLAIQVATHLNKRLIIAGTGNLEHLGYSELPKGVEYFGYADVDQRRKLLANAECLIAPTYYLEPFGNIVPEALLSGTPVITTDWGGFTENNMHGMTGYRCKEFKEFTTAVKNIKNIDPYFCHMFAMKNFSEKVVHDKFDDYFQKVIKLNFYRE